LELELPQLQPLLKSKPPYEPKGPEPRPSQFQPLTCWELHLSGEVPGHGKGGAEQNSSPHCHNIVSILM
jgi:hypothetical protein